MKFNQRFQDFAEIEKGINLFLNPFVDTEEVKEDMQLEVIEIQCDDTPYKSMRKAHAPCQKNTLFIWLTLYLYMSDSAFSLLLHLSRANWGPGWLTVTSVTYCEPPLDDFLLTWQQFLRPFELSASLFSVIPTGEWNVIVIKNVLLYIQVYGTKCLNLAH